MNDAAHVPLRIAELNVFAASDFIDYLGRIYEHSPWVAEAVVNLRPFFDSPSLREAMENAVSAAPHDRQMDLICSHPDLAGRLAQQGALTPESTREQASAGLAEADAAAIAKIRDLNTRYRQRFDFPFIICARLNNVTDILAAMETRISNEPREEIATALTEIHKIARLRLADIVAD